MPHDFADLIADLDAAKAELARSVKRCRTLVGHRRAGPTPAEEQRADKGAFNWSKSDR